MPTVRVSAQEPVSKKASDERLLEFIRENPETTLGYVRSLEDLLCRVRDVVGAPQLPGLRGLVGGLQQDPAVLGLNCPGDDSK